MTDWRRGIKLDSSEIYLLLCALRNYTNKELAKDTRKLMERLLEVGRRYDSEGWSEFEYPKEKAREK